LEKKEAERQFEQLIGGHSALLYKICRIYGQSEADRQDLFQEIIIQAWTAWPRFRGDAKASTWLYRIGINTAISGLRKKKDIIEPYEPSALPLQRGDESYGEEEERLQLLYACINRLNPVEKAIVMLYLEDHSYEEMENILGISQGNLRVKMNRVKEKLRQLTKGN
jgi:RNA polymerase sigma-70 factor, ECF subfamily